jgi:hypothetical protein
LLRFSIAIKAGQTGLPASVEIAYRTSRLDKLAGDHDRDRLRVRLRNDGPSLILTHSEWDEE